MSLRGTRGPGGAVGGWPRPIGKACPPFLSLQPDEGSARDLHTFHVVPKKTRTGCTPKRGWGPVWRGADRHPVSRERARSGLLPGLECADE